MQTIFMESKTIEESIIEAMDGRDVEIIKFLPYIFQDSWEIGSFPEEIIKIIKKHKPKRDDLKVLDLGSGKGAVSIKIALELGYNCFGIDAIEEFVQFSNKKSKEHSVENICKFETNDIRTRIKTLEKYDIIILGAIGPVFGNYQNTLSKLLHHLNPDGIVIIDDAFVEDDCNRNYPNVLRRSDLIKQTKYAGMKIIEIITIDDIPDINISEQFDNEFKKLQKRCIELMEKYPEKEKLFKEHIENQRREYDILENEIIPAMFLIKKS